MGIRPPAPSKIEEIDGLVYITTAKGVVAVVDASDRALVEGFAWQTKTVRNKRWTTTYLRRRFVVEGKARGEALHRRLLNAPEGLCVDHIDGDGLNNRRNNLRLCTQAENVANSLRRSATGVVGVYEAPDCDRYYARICIAGVRKHLGYFATKEEASAAYRKARRIPDEFYAPRPSSGTALFMETRK